MLIGVRRTVAVRLQGPPEPDRPGSGLVAARPGAAGHRRAEQRVRRGGLRGLVWHTYDSAVRARCPPSVNTDTWLGNQTFNLAKSPSAG